MIQRSIDRSRSTGGGMGASFVLHATVLLLLSLLASRQMSAPQSRPELTEISYVEAAPGEDVAALVQEQVKPEPPVRSEMPGRGVETDSAVKPKVDSPAPPEPKAQQPAPVKAAPPRPEPVRRAEPKAEMAAVVAPVPEAKKPVAQAPETKTLTRNETRPAPRQLSAPDPVTRTVAAADVGEAQAPVQAPRKAAAESFQPREAGLKRRTGTIAGGDDVLASTSANTNRQAGLAEASATLASGSLQNRESQPTFAMAGAALKPSSGRSSGGGGVADVAGPASSGGNSGSGRRTILDYGSGNGGRGGSLKGKGRLAEPQATPMESAPSAPSEAPQKVAEAGLDDLGGNMTISGQIQGRKIMNSAPAEYSDLARRKGWEGVVAVHFTVLADGRVKDNLYFEQTSVHRDLNQAAMEAIRKFRFAPLPSDQAAVEQWGVITIVFRLN